MLALDDDGGFRMSRRIVVAIGALIGLAIAGCGSKSKKPATTPLARTETVKKPTKKPTTTPKPPSGDTGPQTSEGGSDFDPIYFAYDESTLDASARAALDAVAAYLRKNPNAKVRIPGHTDQRGTTEYNLMLGEKRARTARDYLINAGIAKGRITIVSYGEEQPAASGDDEEAWARNRRDEFELQIGESQRSSR